MNVTRHKVMVIPYTSDGRALTVQDKITEEWGFISGGVKCREKNLDAASRELCEETSGLLSQIPSFFRRIEFVTSYRPDILRKSDKKRNINVLSKYNIYIFKIDDDFDVSDFKPNSEIKSIKLQYYESIENTWELCDFVFSKLI